MPAATPPVGEHEAAQLAALGQRLRAHRKRHGITAVSAAEAAGLSRVTLHRIERGEPSVTMGAYMSVIHALGLDVEVFDPAARRAESHSPSFALPARVRLADYPQLKALAWQTPGVEELTPAEALALYERNWRHVDPSRLTPNERALVRGLVERLGGGRLLV
jgi:transcriptional regulator with XRE-family HTH domain